MLGEPRCYFKQHSLPSVAVNDSLKKNKQIIGQVKVSFFSSSFPCKKSQLLVPNSVRTF